MLYNDNQREVDMSKTKQVLLLSTNSEVKKRVEEAISDGINVLTTVFLMSNVVEATAIYGFDVLIIDSETYAIDEDMLSLFKKKSYYTPRIFVLSKNYEIKTSEFAKFCGYDDLSIIGETLIELKTKIESQYPFGTQILRENISSVLVNAGLNQKYKGFEYLIDVIYRRMCVDCCSSFKKGVYPYVARLYSATPESIERDVRNIINISTKDDAFLKTIQFNSNYNPTTRNVVDHLVRHVKASI